MQLVTISYRGSIFLVLAWTLGIFSYYRMFCCMFGVCYHQLPTLTLTPDAITSANTSCQHQFQLVPMLATDPVPKLALAIITRVASHTIHYLFSGSPQTRPGRHTWKQKRNNIVSNFTYTTDTTYCIFLSYYRMNGNWLCNQVMRIQIRRTITIKDEISWASNFLLHPPRPSGPTTIPY